MPLLHPCVHPPVCLSTIYKYPRYTLVEKRNMGPEGFPVALKEPHYFCYGHTASVSLYVTWIGFSPPPLMKQLLLLAHHSHSPYWPTHRPQSSSLACCSALPRAHCRQRYTWEQPEGTCPEQSRGLHVVAFARSGRARECKQGCRASIFSPSPPFSWRLLSIYDWSGWS
jgi:hypothetical protein